MSLSGIGGDHTPCSLTDIKISNPPLPPIPSDEKNNVSFETKNGVISFPGVLIFSPMFSGSDHVLSASFCIVQMSIPPKPPGLSDAKTSNVPSEFTVGCELKFSFVQIARLRGFCRKNTINGS